MVHRDINNSICKFYVNIPIGFLYNRKKFYVNATIKWNNLETFSKWKYFLWKNFFFARISKFIYKHFLYIFLGFFARKSQEIKLSSSDKIIQKNWNYKNSFYLMNAKSYFEIAITNEKKTRASKVSLLSTAFKNISKHLSIVLWILQYPHESILHKFLFFYFLHFLSFFLSFEFSNNFKGKQTTSPIWIRQRKLS